MAKLSFMKFYPKDYLYDTRILTPEERGVWMDLICFSWNAAKRGELSAHPQNMAQMIGLEWNGLNIILDSLKSKNICGVLRNGDGTVTLLLRRMLRDGDALQKNYERVKKYRESTRLRMIRYRKNLCNDSVMDKKSEAKKSEVIKDSIESPNGDTPKPLTDIQKVVGVYKVTSGYKKEDKAWDKLNYARCCRSAKQLLDFLGNWKDAGDCIQDIYEKLTAKGLTVTLETICKHAADWKKNLQELDPEGRR